MFKKTQKAKKSRAAKSAAEASAGRRHRVRLAFVAAIFVCAYAAIGTRLVWVHLFPDVRFQAEEKGHIGRTPIERPRGDILDREGRLLATDRATLSLAMDPSRTEEPNAMLGYLRARLDFDQERVREAFAATGNKRDFVWIKRYLSDEEIAAIGELKDAPDDDALMFKPERLRFYPNGDLAAHVLGFANREGKGQEGIESRYDSYLRSEPGQKVSRVDRKRRILNFLTIEFEPAQGGDDVTLTLDADLQHSMELALDNALADRQAAHAMGMLMDVNTGAILALATRPAFDPNHYWDFAAEQRKNRAVVDVFEPGSAFKIVPASAALELGFITPSDLIDCENGSFNPYGHTIRDTHPRGVIPFWQCFAESSNIATIKVASIVGPERLESWIRRFGFGSKSGIDLPMESAGLVWPRTQWSRLSMGSLPIGQEIAVNAIQLARSFAAIANGGYLIEPHLVSRAISPEGESTYRHVPPAPVRILSPETAETMKELCHEVVIGEESTGRYAAIQEYRVGGKTGTAQIARPKEEGGGYYERKYTAVFAGFAPIADPRLVCVVVMREPKYGEHWGGRACGPVFKEVMRNALILLNVPEDPMLPADMDRATRVAAARIPALPGADADTIVARLNLELYEPVEELIEPIDLELRHAADGLAPAGPSLPDFSGMTKREAASHLVALGLAWDPQGAGRVIGQNPPAGTPLDDVGVCQLVFSTAPQETLNET